MDKARESNSAAELRKLPSVDLLLRTETARALAPRTGLAHLTDIARRVTEELRQQILNSSLSEKGNGSRAGLLREAETRLRIACEKEDLRGLRRVINATGVILHTNLGRAPLSPAARGAIENASGYCALEYDITTGARGRRGGLAEDLLVELADAEAALVVNNCAAAALLVLSTFARNGETIVSRGELVEIGGDFRVPEVMAQSGTRMVEVGTTNRTRLSDYRQAITDDTRLLMRVHTSNYRIVGFTKTPGLSELAELAQDHDLILYEDAGSGALVDFKELGVAGEPVIRESIRTGAGVVSFSGDKLLGGPQAGLIVGRKQLIERMRANPLYRALRADKLRLAALEATLLASRCEEKTPVQEMLGYSHGEIKRRAEEMIARVRPKLSKTILLETIAGESAVGGGAAPTSPLPTTLISVRHVTRTANEVEAALRNSEPAIVARILDDQVVIDLRTVTAPEESEVELALRALA